MTVGPLRRRGGPGRADPRDHPEDRASGDLRSTLRRLRRLAERPLADAADGYLSMRRVIGGYLDGVVDDPSFRPAAPTVTGHRAVHGRSVGSATDG